MYESNIKSGSISTSEPAAKMIITFAAQLAKTAEELNARTHTKLSPIMTSSSPAIRGTEELKQAKEYPPLFDELRGYLMAMERALTGIEDAILRTEL